MEVGKLYKTKELYWMLYPSKDTAAVGGHAPLDHVAAAYWSKQLNNVSYISPNSMFVLLEENGKYCKVLSTEGMVGWIILAGWFKRDIEEVKAE